MYSTSKTNGNRLAKNATSWRKRTCMCAYIHVHVWQQNCLDFKREPFGVKECALPRPCPTFIYMHYTPVQCRYMYSFIPKAMCCHLPVQTSKTNTQQKTCSTRNACSERHNARAARDGESLSARTTTYILQ